MGLITETDGRTVRRTDRDAATQLKRQDRTVEDKQEEDEMGEGEEEVGICWESVQTVTYKYNTLFRTYL